MSLLGEGIKKKQNKMGFRKVPLHSIGWEPSRPFYAGHISLPLPQIYVYIRGRSFELALCF